MIVRMKNVYENQVIVRMKNIYENQFTGEISTDKII